MNRSLQLAKLALIAELNRDGAVMTLPKNLDPSQVNRSDRVR
jgi:hypothetical protein